MIYIYSYTNPIQLFLAASYITNTHAWSIVYDSSSNCIGDIIHLGDWSVAYDCNSNKIGSIRHYESSSIIYDLNFTKIGYIKHKEFLSTVYSMKNNRIIEYRNDDGYNSILH